MKPFIQWLALFVASISGNQQLFAAKLLRQELVMDGSAEPPGDRLELSVLFRPNEQPFTLEVRAFIVKDEVAQPVSARGDQNRDADGNLLIRAEVKPGDSPIVNVSVVVPYADIKLPLGIHKLGYELSGVRDEKTLFVQATKLTGVQLTEEPRTKMYHRIGVRRANTYTRELTVFSVDQANVTQRVVEQEITEEPKLYFEAKEVVVNIPNSFKRLADRSIASVEDDDPIKNQTQGMKGKPWVPVRHKVVYYATNRNVIDANDFSVKRFGLDVSPEISYGSCLVNIPTEAAHERGKLETPGWWGANPDKHFFIEKLNTLSKANFYELLGNQLRDATNPRDILLFVHGYNNSMEFVLLRAAQVVHDIQFVGSTMVFSWPSQGSAGDYGADEVRAANSVDALTTVLQQLASERKFATTSPGKIHIIAHSMGNRVLLNAVQKLASGLATDERPLGHVILAAPDVGIDDFVKQIPFTFRAADDVTLYFCEEDKALQLSRELHNKKRAGEGLVAIPSLLNIDSAKANTSLLGHDYFASNSLLLIDLDMFINANLQPPKRQTIRNRVETIMNADYRYWAFP